MEIKIAGVRMRLYKDCTVNLKYDSVASTFAFTLYFDPTNAEHKRIFKPYTYQPCTISHEGVLLLTGTVLSAKFLNAGDPPVHLVHVSGYSKTGVLEDCTPVHSPLQMDNDLPFIEVVRKMCKHYMDVYGFDIVVDPEVKDICNTPIPQANPDPDESVARYLDKLASHLNVVLSHDRRGNLVLTKVKSDRLLTTASTVVHTDNTAFTTDIEGAPDDDGFGTTTQKSDRAVLYDFSNPGQWEHMDAEYNGQALHSDVVAVSEADPDGKDNSIQSEPLQNPFVQGSRYNTNAFEQGAGTTSTNRGMRPLTIVQQQQAKMDDNAAPKTARSVIGDELKATRVMVKVKSWTLNGNMITANQMITVQNPALYLYNKTRLFIQEVTLTGDEVVETATITAVPPSAFGTDEVEAIF